MPVLILIGVGGIGSISSSTFSPSIGRAGSIPVLMLIGVGGINYVFIKNLNISSLNFYYL